MALLFTLLPRLLLDGGWYTWIYKALLISKLVTIVSGLAAAARQGILIKGGVYLEKGRCMLWLAFDKIGTLTHVKLVLTDGPLFDTQDIKALYPLTSWLGLALQPSCIAGGCADGGHSRNPRVTALKQQGKTLVMLMGEGCVQELFAMTDALKSHSRDAITQLHQLGVNALMLSSNNTPTTKVIAVQAVSVRRMATYCRQINCKR